MKKLFVLLIMVLAMHSFTACTPQALDDKQQDQTEQASDYGDDDDLDDDDEDF